MLLIVNGQDRELTELGPEAKLSEIVDALGLQRDRVAIEHNGLIAARPEWEAIQIFSGDKLEIVHFVGGGQW